MSLQSRNMGFCTHHSNETDRKLSPFSHITSLISRIHHSPSHLLLLSGFGVTSALRIISLFRYTKLLSATLCSCQSYTRRVGVLSYLHHFRYDLICLADSLVSRADHPPSSSIALGSSSNLQPDPPIYHHCKGEITVLML